MEKWTHDVLLLPQTHCEECFIFNRRSTGRGSSSDLGFISYSMKNNSVITPCTSEPTQYRSSVTEGVCVCVALVKQEVGEWSRWAVQLGAKGIISSRVKLHSRVEFSSWVTFPLQFSSLSLPPSFPIPPAPPPPDKLLRIWKSERKSALGVTLAADAVAMAVENHVKDLNVGWKRNELMVWGRRGGSERECEWERGDEREGLMGNLIV